MANLSGPVHSNPLATTQNPVPAFFSGGQAPRRLRWAESEAVLAYRPARSRLIALLAVFLWNVGFYIFVPAKQFPLPRPIFTALLLAVLLLALRECFLVVRMRFDSDRLIVTGGPLAPWIRVSLPIVDVDRVLLLRRENKGARLEAAVHSGRPVPLKISFDGPPIKGSWSPKMFFLADESVYLFAAERLNAKLEEAKHRTGPTYR